MSQKSEKPQTTKNASCNCKAVQLTVTGVDKGAVLCHCSNCQSGSGSAFAHNHRFMPAELKIVKGENVLKRYGDGNTKSGNILYRHFCGNCGSPLFLIPSAVKGLVVLNAGNIQGEKVQPRSDLYPENRHSWVGDLTTKARL